MQDEGMTIAVLGALSKRSHAAIEMYEHGQCLGHIRLQASELEVFALQIAQARELLADQVSPQLDPGSRVLSVPEPGWAVSTLPTSQQGFAVLMALRHPGLGWLSFALAPERARSIGEALLAALNP